MTFHQYHYRNYKAERERVSGYLDEWRGYSIIKKAKVPPPMPPLYVDRLDELERAELARQSAEDAWIGKMRGAGEI